MQPIKVSSVVLPEPLGPVKAVIFPGSITRLTPSSATHSFGLPALKIFRTLESLSILPCYLICESGSIMAAFHEGTIVATVYGMTVKKKSVVTW